MSGSERIVQQSVLRPSVLNHGLASQSLDFGFTPIATVSPPNQFIPQAVRPVPTNSGNVNSSITTTTGGSNGLVLSTGPMGGGSLNRYPVTSIPTSKAGPQTTVPSSTSGGLNGFGVSASRPYKRKPLINNSQQPSTQLSSSLLEDGSSLEPQRKLHLSEDFVAQTMSELYISPPTCKVAKRDLNRDVAEAINLEALEELECKFSNQAINDDVILPQRIRRSRKLPCRQRQPQLRLTLHEDLKKVKSASGLPETLLSRYRPSARTGGNSTALVLWKPPGGFLPDLINNALRGGVARGGRARCYSEVTSTPYSSHENLVTGEMEDMLLGRSSSGGRTYSPLSASGGRTHSPLSSAEAPELSTSPQSEDEILPSVGLQRRNSAPEISEPLQYMDDERCMEL